MQPLIARVQSLFTPVSALCLGVYALIVILLPWGPIQWGDGLELAAVSNHPGIAHPPGYPLLTLVGYLLSRLPLLDSYAALLLVSRASAILVVVCLYTLSRNLLASILESDRRVDILSVMMALLFGFSDLMFRNMAAPEVYLFNAAFIAGILLALGRTGSPASVPVILAASALLGLAAANHLTALSLGGVVVLSVVHYWIARRSGGSLLLAPVLVVLIPAILYGSLLLRVPDSADAYGIYWGAPESVAELATHVRGGEYGSFLFMQLRPGIPFTAGTYSAFLQMRTAQFLTAAGSVIFGGGPAAFGAGAAGLQLVIYGGFVWWRRKLGSYFLVGISCSVLLQIAFVYTYNIPDIESYFLAILLQLFPFFVVGFASCVNILFSAIIAEKEKPEIALLLVAGTLLLFGLLTNLTGFFLRDRQIGAQWRERILIALPEDAALITYADADIYTIWFTQMVEGERTDIAVYGANFTRFAWSRFAIHPDDPRREAVSFREGAPTGLREYVADLEQCAVEPLLQSGRVFTTINEPAVLGELQKRYRLLPRGQLLKPGELQDLLDAGEVNIAPPLLYEIVRHGSETTEK